MSGAYRLFDRVPDFVCLFLSRRLHDSWVIPAVVQLRVELALQGVVAFVGSGHLAVGAPPCLRWGGGASIVYSPSNDFL